LRRGEVRGVHTNFRGREGGFRIADVVRRVLHRFFVAVRVVHRGGGMNRGIVDADQPCGFLGGFLRVGDGEGDDLAAVMNFV
jgi:hypothetical protein